MIKTCRNSNWWQFVVVLVDSKVRIIMHLDTTAIQMKLD